MARIRSQVGTAMQTDLSLVATCPCSKVTRVPSAGPAKPWPYEPGAASEACEHYLGLAAGPANQRVVACFSIPERGDKEPWE